ncbi:MAG: non-hydrolyzing UDP-N-acetylglucosamine 2-epimerase [Acidimicrobiales bacterium]
MASVRRVMTVFGTRPEAIKLAPVVLALAASSAFDPIVVVTAQHREMLDQVLSLFDIVPDVDLQLIQAGQSLSDLTARSLAALSPVVERARPDCVVVQGDTTTTLTGAIAGFYHRIPVVHLEAGLRTGMRYSPFPEELNRRLTSQLTSLHLAPTREAKANLVAEGADPTSVVVTGNTVIDALQWAIHHPRPYENPVLECLDTEDRRVILVTAHRRESWGKAMIGIGSAVAEIANSRPDTLVVFPIHRNPAVRRAIASSVDGVPNILVIEPLGYASFVRLLARSHLVLTDSGGMQEEGPSLGKPVLVMRETTERPEAVEAGVAALVGTDPARIVAATLRLLDDRDAYEAMSRVANPYGDGHATPRALAALAHLFGDGPLPEEFVPTCPLATGDGT